MIYDHFEQNKIMKKYTKRFLLYLLIITCFYPIACNCPDQSQKEINQLLDDYYQTMSDRDWPNYKLFFTDDATLTTVWQEETDTVPKILTHSISEFIAQTKDGPDSQPIFEEKMNDTKIEVNNNLAQAWVNYSAKFGSKDNLYEWKGVDLFSFIRHKEEWKIVSIVFESE